LAASLQRPNLAIHKPLMALAWLLIAGVGLYVVALTVLLIGWQWLLAGAAGLAVAVDAWWLWWQLAKRQVERLRHTLGGVRQGPG
jgi:membrane protein implicated in regulation of membrane protease activity